MRVNASTYVNMTEFFHDGGRCHIETSPLICSANEWIGFYKITASVMKELIMLNMPAYTLINRVLNILNMAEF